MVTNPESSPQPTTSDAAAVEAVVRDYIDSWHEGDATRMERTLHDDLLKQTPAADEPAEGLRRVPKSRMVDLTAEGGGASPGAAADVTVHHVEGDIASARVATAEYLDYLHLVRAGGEWRIIHDLFHQRG